MSSFDCVLPPASEEPPHNERAQEKEREIGELRKEWNGGAYCAGQREKEKMASVMKMVSKDGGKDMIYVVVTSNKALERFQYARNTGVLVFLAVDLKTQEHRCFGYTRNVS
ncbi:hypothetical protein PIB30_028333 [Stylosanthes scabra]|uniref:Uncharacterized protein n=1 Tax=Stylosanthes scabra TaxID=79078 RepID=A0ABU6Z7S5_9FABA|nr:hypothetical protein [Stylosanthes scabra]